MCIVLVHGCCTTHDDVSEYDQLADKMVGEIIKKNSPNAWEIVVWDWTKDTPKNGGIWSLADAHTAYNNARPQGRDLLEPPISKYLYKYIHMIGHSAGARLIHEAASVLTKTQTNKPFIHLTFLDAFRPFFDEYGNLENYSERFSEHYVDVGLPQTDDYLPHAFSFDITDWHPVSHQDPDEKRDNGHQWPRAWYEPDFSVVLF
jgi:hypothetical protein